MKCNYFLVVTKKEYHNHDKTKHPSCTQISIGNASAEIEMSMRF